MKLSTKLLLLLVPGVLIALNLLTIPGYTGDDAYIHFTYARNVAEHGVFAYNTATPTYGSTSVLWVLTGAALSLVTRDVPTTMRVLSGLFFLLNAWLMILYVGRRHTTSTWMMLSVLIVYLCNAVWFRWLNTGMEVNLAEAAMLVLLLWYDPGRPVRSALLCLAAYAIRPELLLLPAAHAVALMAEERRLSGRLLRFLGVCALVFSLWFLAAYAYFGSLFPLTSAKYGDGPDAWSLQRFAEVAGGTYPDLLLAIAVLMIGTRALKGMGSWLTFNERFLLCAAVGLLGFYMMSGTMVLSRYLLLVHVPLVVILLGLSRGVPLSRTVSVVAVVVLLVQPFLFWKLHDAHVRSFVSGFQTSYRAIGEMIERRDDRDTSSVYGADVGILGYYSRRPVVDGAGLVSRHVMNAGTRDEITLIGLSRPRYIVARMKKGGFDDFLRRLTAAVPMTGAPRILYRRTIAPLGVMAGGDEEVCVLEADYG